MKIYYLPLILSFLIVLTLVKSLQAQQTFDSKKKKSVSVNTTSLNAVHINGATYKGGRIPSASRMVRSALKFPQSMQHQKPEKIYYSNETGLPFFIISTSDKKKSQLNVKKDITSTAYNYLLELQPILQLENPELEFKVHDIKTDNNNRSHVRLSQLYKGIPVYGAEVMVHMNEYGIGESFNGNYYNFNENIDPIPAISEQLAVDKVGAHLGGDKPLSPLTSQERQLVQHEEPIATLCIYHDKSLVTLPVLAYHIIYCPKLQERWEYFVNASTGTILHRFQTVCFADGPRTATGLDLNGISRSIQTYQKGATFFLLDISRPMYTAVGSELPDQPVGGILTVDMNNTFGDDQAIQHNTSTNNNWNTALQTKALSAHFNAGAAYEYYRTKHNRNSIDGEGGTIISIINVPDEEGKAMDNAFWNGKLMCYGNGNLMFKPLAGGMDVAGHEMTHGVVQNTANLEYQGESGAINESMADIFGSMMDPADWLIGEDVVKPAGFPSGAMRSMSDPHNGGTNLSHPGYQPKHLNEVYTGTEDNGGVHINSGIPNHAFYKFAEAITREKAAAVFYKALDDYLTKSSKFIDLRLAVAKAASDLYGAGSNEVIQAGIAFDAVGITTGQGGEYTESLPDNPGTEFMLVYNTDTSDPNTLYRTSLSSNPVSLTQTVFNSRPSVTDKGDVAVFVAADHTIHIIHTAPGASPAESVLQDEQIWSNVVVSKGGTKLAAVTTAEEPIIYVYDFESEQWGEFELYNPTYSEGVNSKGPVYADALEWDYSGEFLVYDCFNRIDNNDGLDIEYWDVNFIHVWDNSDNDFASGTIEKLFASLPADVSIGNPSFAKNSPSIIAFDYVNEDTEEYAIVGCNIETSDLNVVAENNTLGWPSFNKNDSRIAFTTLHETTDYKSSYVVLNSDKISSSVTAQDLYLSTKWPVYFASGEREIGDEVVTGVLSESNHNLAMSCYPNPFTDEVFVEFKEQAVTGSRVEVITTTGQRIYESAIENSSAPLHFNLESLKPGFYVMKISDSKKIGRCRIVKK